MKRTIAIVIITIYSLNAFAQSDTITKPREIKERPKSEYVSIINLIANPEKYQGKRVTVIGYMSAEFEGTAIYLSREDFDHKISKNAIFLNIGKAYEYKLYHKEYVSLDGIFTKGGGHFGVYSGMLNNVEYITKHN